MSNPVRITVLPMSKCPWRSPVVPREPSALAGAPPSIDPAAQALGDCLRDACALWKSYPIELQTSAGPVRLTGMCSFRFLAEASDPLAGAIQQLAALTTKIAGKFGVLEEPKKGS